MSRIISGLTEEAPEHHWLVWVGLREALNNFSLSLIFAILTSLAATLGAHRMAKRIDESAR